MSRKLHEIALSFLVDIGPVTARNLVSYCGSAQAVFEETTQRLLKIPGVGKHRAAFNDRSKALKRAESELKHLEKNNLNAHFYLDESYAERLKVYPDSPIILYTTEGVEFNHPRTLAIVGTRKPTDYGRMKCEQIVQELRKYDIAIVSGLAYGVDVIAHKTSVANGIPTIGVLGNGLPNVYPSTHNSIAKKMQSMGGGLVTQFSSEEKPDREHFPMRNKTVAYMTDATLVIESKASGGSMITANFAFHNHKDLFALPGRTIDTFSEGCNKLIKANLAQMVTCGEDIVKSMLWDIEKPKARQAELFHDLSDEESKIINSIQASPEIHVDKLAKEVGMNNAQLAAALLQLELKGLIRQSAGKRYLLAN